MIVTVIVGALQQCLSELHGQHVHEHFTTAHCTCLHQVVCHTKNHVPTHQGACSPGCVMQLKMRQRRQKSLASASPGPASPLSRSSPGCG